MRKKKIQLIEDIGTATRNSFKNESGTSEYVLGKFLTKCLKAFDKASVERDDGIGTEEDSLSCYKQMTSAFSKYLRGWRGGNIWTEEDEEAYQKANNPNSMSGYQ